MTIDILFNHPIVCLNKQNRFSDMYIIKEENVAEHTTQVGTIAILLANEFNNNGANFDVRELAFRSLIHDWGEAVTCDVTSPVKYSHPDLAKLLNLVEIRGLNKLGFSEKLIQDINNSRDDHSFHGELVFIADRLSAYMKLWREYMIQRTKYLRDQLINSVEDVTQIISNYADNFDNESCKSLCYQLSESIIKAIDHIKEKKDFI